MWFAGQGGSLGGDFVGIGGCVGRIGWCGGGIGRGRGGSRLGLGRLAMVVYSWLRVKLMGWGKGCGMLDREGKGRRTKPVVKPMVLK